MNCNSSASNDSVIEPKLRIDALQHADTLDVMGLREEVGAADALTL